MLHTPVTLQYASLLAFSMVLLMLYTILRRRKLQVRLGHGDDSILLSRTRAHANFCEHAPLLLFILFLLETHGWSYALLHAYGIAIVVSRAAHAYGLTIMEHRNPSSLMGRFVGTLTTVLLFLMGGYLLLFSGPGTFPGWA